MTKDQALLNFQAVQNYLMWKDFNLICTTIDQGSQYFECRLYFNPNEWPVENLQNEIDRVVDGEAQVEISPVRNSKYMCLTIDWNYQ